VAFKVFVSYSTRDLPVARALWTHLRIAGAEVYVAEYSAMPGQSLSKVIAKAIDECDLFLLLWSTNADQSKWVPQEIGRAKGKGKPIMPVVLHAGIALTGFIQDLKYLEWYKNPDAVVAWLNDFVLRERAKKDKEQLLGSVIAVGAILLALGSGSE
jgi:hypothetical protein